MELICKEEKKKLEKYILVENNESGLVQYWLM